MSQPILPKDLREKISFLHNQGHSKNEIFGTVIEQAKNYVQSDYQLWRCICSIVRTKSLKKNPPTPFECGKHQDTISKLDKRMPGKEFEIACTPIVMDILTNYEGFEDVKDANIATGFTNPPFDFFGFKSGSPYIIEFKGSLVQFNGPSKLQRERQEKLRDRIESLNLALLQVNLDKCEYRMLLNEEIDDCYPGHEIPLDPIEKWLKARLRDFSP